MTLLNLHEWGDPAGPPVVCLHGVTSDGTRFRRLAADEFLRHFRVLAPDLRGHGFSDWEPPWDLDTHVHDVLETLAAAGVDRAPLVGHSFGGRIAIELAARQPALVECLILLDPAIWVPPPMALERAEAARADVSYSSVAEAIEDRLAAGTARTPRAVVEDDLPGHLELGEDGRWRFRFLRSAVVAAYGEMTKPPPLERISAPTLIVHALESEVVPEVLLEAFLAALPDSDVVAVPGGHIVMWDSFEETIAAMRVFLTRFALALPR